MTDYFDQMHSQYAQQDWIHKPSLFAEWALQHFPPPGRLLDVGGGQGQDAKFFAEKGYDVTLVDFSESALSKAKEKILDAAPGVRIMHHDIRQPLPFHEGDFEVVYAHMSLHYFTTKETYEIFDSLYGVLSPGGVIALLVNSAHDPEFGTGEKIEPFVYHLHGVTKRYFDMDTIRQFTGKFDTLVLDEQGETYKDRALGVHNLIRFVGRKP